MPFPATKYIYSKKLNIFNDFSSFSKSKETWRLLECMLKTFQSYLYGILLPPVPLSDAPSANPRKITASQWYFLLPYAKLFSDARACSNRFLVLWFSEPLIGYNPASAIALKS